MYSPADLLLRLPQHLAHDPGLAALVNAFRTFLKFSEDSADVLRLVQSYPGLVAEATKVMEKFCTGSYPVAQGGFNTVFLLTFADGTDALARLRGGPSSESTAFSSDVLAHQFISEVTTIAFVREYTSIPAPELYYYDCNAKNALGTPYMLMKRITGESLGTTWASLSAEQRERVVSAVAHIEAQLLRVPLHAIGSIISANGTVGPLAPSSTYTHSLRDPHRGPFTSSKHLVEAYIRCELLLISERCEWTMQRTKWRHLNGGVDDMPAKYAIRWFSLLLAAIRAVPSEEFDDPAHFTLYHNDLGLNNILVSPSGTVVGLVDWQGSHVRPLWDATRHTHFLQDENLVDTPHELNRLQKIQQDIIFEQTGLRPGSSRLRLSYTAFRGLLDSA
ncbi:kinase-like domain-containing protein [Mycena metata]|uniref:Kinase-like domain-containing protein n=1 Tax=Mycena metata TaxID=1033252 RepID=A0AAD7H929_9AGAR|nr:kinase-like domain-containing protein [Mycena metata]